MKRFYTILPIIICLFFVPAVLNAQDNGNGTNSGTTLLGWIGLTAVESSTGNLQESYIIINPEATYGFDQLFDATFLQGQGPVFYSLSGEEKLSTNSIPALSSEMEVSFVFNPSENGSYRLYASGLELIENQVYLYDQLAKSDVNLSQNPEYTFMANIGDDTTRFILHFKPTGMESPEEPTGFEAYYSNNTLYFNTLRQSDNVSIYDLRGAKVLNMNMNETLQHSMLVQLPKGVYIARLQSGSTCMNSKFLVR